MRVLAPGYRQNAAWRLQIGMALLALTALLSAVPGGSTWGVSLAGLLLLLGWLTVAAAGIWVLSHAEGKRFTSVLLGAALLLPRLAAWWIAGPHQPAGDPEIYLELARTLMAGEGLRFADPLTGTTFLALFPPVYPTLLAALGKFGLLNPTGIWLFNLLCDLCSMLLLLRIGQRLSVAEAGRGAALLFALWPAFALAVPIVQKESLCLTLVLAAATAALAVRERARWSDAALFGISSGALALTQPGLALLPGLFLLCLTPMSGWRPPLQLVIRAAPFALVLLLPWWIRNAQLFGEFVPLTTTAGLGLWIGNNPEATGDWMPLPARFSGLGEVEMSRRAGAEALAWIVQHPFDALRISVEKAFRALGGEHATLRRMTQAAVPPAPSQMAALFPLLQGSLFALYALLAATTARWWRDPGTRLLLAAAALQLLFFSLPFEFGERHRYFLMPLLFLAAASAVPAGLRCAARVRTPRARFRASSRTGSGAGRPC